VDLSDIIIGSIDDKYKDENTSDNMLPLILRGSSGIGKSTFLAYLIAKLMSNEREANLEHIAIFHASNAAISSSGSIDLSSVKYFISKTGQAQQGIYSASLDWEAMLAGAEVIIMDVCSMTIDLEEFFTGVVIVAASPRQYTKNLQVSIFRKGEFTMHPVEKD
jgi:adenylate kinase family enzyme